MDHNLDDSLNLEGSIGEMDFEHHDDTVVNQADITLEASGHEEDIPMEFEHIEEQPILMDTENEEIIDFMGDQFTLQEYSVQQDQTADITTGNDPISLNVLTSQSETMIDLQFEPQIISTSVKQEINHPKYISVKAAIPATRVTSGTKKMEGMPRQVAIAPKPSAIASQTHTQTTFGPNQYPIAPKPVALISKKTSIVKAVSLASATTNATNVNTVLAQVGKQLVMLPSGGQKIKLVSANTGMPALQYIRTNEHLTKSSAGASKAVMAKVIVQGQPNLELSNQPAVITKLIPTSSTGTVQARYVMQQKTVPISMDGNKVLLSSSPTKQTAKVAKKQQLIAIKTPALNLLPTSSGIGTTKKILIPSNPQQNIILKTTAPPKTTQVIKDGTVVMHGQRSQLHQINVPGKGIQYIRLITTPSTTAKPEPKSQQLTPALAVPSKSFVLTDTKVESKHQKKLVRIAPLVTKCNPSTLSTRSAQSLLAPLSPKIETRVTGEDVTDMLDRVHSDDHSAEIERIEIREDVRESQVQVKREMDTHSTLQELIADAVGNQSVCVQEVEVPYPRQILPDDGNDDDMDEINTSSKNDDHPLIVIPSNYVKQPDHVFSEDNSTQHTNYVDEANVNMNVEPDISYPYLSPKTPQALSEQAELDLRPRKACNCTKSQCLKLYCDCFANGEFCNRCNCNNCHNNLENEELRQKAIRACLDRNPNAFRPKIGKARSGGPEIIRRHNKGCNCKRSGCLKNYCECFEAKIACTAMCKCVGCRNIEDSVERRREVRARRPDLAPRAHAQAVVKQPCSFMTSEVIEAVCQCLLAAAVNDGEGDDEGEGREESEGRDSDPLRNVIEEFARCLQDIISASHQDTPLSVLDQDNT